MMATPVEAREILCVSYCVVYVVSHLQDDDVVCIKVAQVPTSVPLSLPFTKSQ